MTARSILVALALAVLALPLASAAAGGAGYRDVTSTDEGWTASSSTASGEPTIERSGSSEPAAEDASTSAEAPAAREEPPAPAPSPAVVETVEAATDLPAIVVALRDPLAAVSVARNVLAADFAHPILPALDPAPALPRLDAIPVRADSSPARAAPAPAAASDEAPASDDAEPAASAPPASEPAASAPPAGPVARALATPEAKAAAASAALAIPALMGFALYSRLKGAEVLENGTRRRLYDALDGAGLGVDAAAKLTGLAYGTVQYHLDRLAESGYAVRETHAGRVLYFKNGGALNAQERGALPVLANAETLRVLADVLAHPGTYRAEIAERLGVTSTAVSWHLKRLAANGLLREEKDGRRQRILVDREKLGALAGLAEKLRTLAPERAAPVAFEVVGARAVGA